MRGKPGVTSGVTAPPADGPNHEEEKNDRDHERDYHTGPAAEKAVLDIVDLAALMNSIADGMKSDVAQITGPQLALLAGLLNDRAEAAYDVISTVANWAPEAQAALYAVHGVKGAAA
ncbi:MAG: hypothetical protein B7Z77_08515 [Acidocella sp. 20-58-15]|nr:MAG: hypothetical protein B7Z77_08515 [Acidocella sp. 20-58-15]